MKTRIILPDYGCALVSIAGNQASVGEAEVESEIFNNMIREASQSEKDPRRGVSGLPSPGLEN